MASPEMPLTLTQCPALDLRPLRASVLRLFVMPEVSRCLPQRAIQDILVNATWVVHSDGHLTISDLQSLLEHVPLFG